MRIDLINGGTMYLKTNSTDISIVFGASSRISDKLDMTCRVALGVREVFSENRASKMISNNVFQLGMGYKF